MPSPARKHKTLACHATPGHALRAPLKFRFRFRSGPGRALRSLLIALRSKPWPVAQLRGALPGLGQHSNHNPRPHAPLRPWPRPAQPPRRSAPGCPPAWTGAPRAPRRFRVRPWPRPAQPPRRSAPGCPPAWTGAPRAPRSARRAPAARCGCQPPPRARAPAPQSAAVPAIFLLSAAQRSALSHDTRP